MSELTIWAMAAAAAAGFALFPAPTSFAAARTRGSPSVRWAWAPLTVGGVAAVAAVAMIFGRVVVVTLLVAALVLGTGWFSWRRARAARRRLRARGEVARACRVLAAELRLGLVPSRALARAAGDCPILARAAAAAAIGSEVAVTWRVQAGVPGQEGLLELARSWQLAQTTGAPLADGLTAVAESLRATHKVDQTVAGELAAPRLTGRLLAALPAFGLALGYLLGGDPIGFLLRQPWGNACLLVGTALACAGLLWTDHLADQVVQG